MNELIKHLMEKYGPGAVQGEIIPVSGGFMHKMYKVKTLSGTYAVKCLNPDIMKRPGVMENYARAEALEHILEENDVPVVSALSFAGRKMLETDGRFFYIFKWLEYNIRRALGLEGSDDTIIGESEVRNTIARIAYLASLETEICSVLGRLPEFKTEVDR